MGRILTLFKRFIVIVLVVAVAVLSFLYWGVYENGVLAGKVLRVSEKGVLFKTYEGKINIETFGALRDASPIAESYDFSVEKHEKALLDTLSQVALSGERVTLHFKKRYIQVPWRGDTRTFVTRVIRAK